MYLCIYMRKKRVLLILSLCLAQLTIWAQHFIPVGAIIETNTHFWKLDTIWFSNQSTFIPWTIVNKTSNAELKVEGINRLIDCTSGKQYDALEVYPLTTFSQQPFTKSKVYMRFPGFPSIPSVVSFYNSTLFHVDSIFSYTKNHLIINKHKVLTNNTPVLKSRRDSLIYADELYDSGIELFKKKKFLHALWKFEQLLAFERLLYEDWTENLVKTSNTTEWLSHSLYKVGDIGNAKLYWRDYKIEPYDRRTTKAADSLRYRAYVEAKQEPYVSQVPKYKRICELYSVHLGEKSYPYIESLYELGDEYYEHKDYKSAKRVLAKALNILDENYKKDVSLYEDIYELLAYLADEEGDIYSAIRYAEKRLLVRKDTKTIINDGVIVSGYNQLVEYYAAAGMWDKAIELQKKKTEYWKQLYQGNANHEYTYYMNFLRLIQLMSLSGNNKGAIRELVNWERNAHVADVYVKGAYENLANYYFNIMDYQKAEEYYKRAHNRYGVIKTYAQSGKYQTAIHLLKELLEEEQRQSHITVSLDLEQQNGPHEMYLSDLADMYNKVGMYDSALVYESRHLIPSRYELARSYYNIGNAYYGKGQWNKAIGYYVNASEIYKHHSQNRQYAIVLTALLHSYEKTGSVEGINHYIDQLMQPVCTDLLSTIQELTYDERSRYIDYYSDLLNCQVPMYAYYTHSNSITEAAYNASLMMKGALLNSEKSVKRVVEKSQDESLKELWDKMKADRYIMSKELEKDSLNRKLNVDSLQKVIYSLEDSLIVKCKEYGNITRSMKLKWKDVQLHLHADDVAIEFLSFPVNNDSLVYVALSLRKDSECPKMISLFDEKQLRAFPDSLHYQCKEMTNLVWKPLEAELQGIKNIYFSPSGVLYNIGIEYLPGMEKYNIYRLSSTRELVTSGKTETKNRAVLYGGLRYDAGFDKSVTEKSLAMLDEAFKERANVRGMGLRGGKEYLKHTKEEVDIIGKEFDKVKWECLIDSAAMGTEESFKALSGRKIGCLHISTHGFYYTQEDADNAHYKFMLIDNNMVSAEDKALIRSGLVMSGANHILEDEKLPDNVEDGILTAKEIADVDLHGLDLVVLSACQTGLGDIAQGEGVFGLQRGFKKAGANSILMSLWEVDDKATQILMTQFYRNLLSGHSKRQSLLSAQKYLREVDGGTYNAPKYWAAFILLDAIN